MQINSGRRSEISSGIENGKALKGEDSYNSVVFWRSIEIDVGGYKCI